MSTIQGTSRNLAPRSGLRTQASDVVRLLHVLSDLVEAIWDGSLELEGAEFFTDPARALITEMKTRYRMPHESVVMEQIPRTAHYHTKSWSYLFRCPSCGWEKRQNTNYLGRRKMFCNGIVSGPAILPKP